jgi:hypothetical protein
MSRLRQVSCRLLEKMTDVRAEPPVGKMLVVSLLVYAAMCLYGLAQS